MVKNADLSKNSDKNPKRAQKSIELGLLIIVDENVVVYKVNYFL